MKQFKLVQKQYNALGLEVVATTDIGTFASHALAEDFLVKREYRFDPVSKAWIKGNTVQFPVTIEEKDLSIFDIRSFA